MQANEPGSAGRGAVPAFAAAAIAGLVLVAYWFVLSRQGWIELPRVLFFSLYIGGLGLGALAGALSRRRDGDLAKPLLVGVAVGSLATGVLALMSIGLPLLIAGVLALLGVGTRPVSPTSLLIAVLVPIGILAAGLMVVS
ncbi:MAG: hypothetical protein ACRDGQ_14790 [Candidatus Limnocylindrales bacterium]